MTVTHSPSSVRPSSASENDWTIAALLERPRREKKERRRERNVEMERWEGWEAFKARA